MASLTFTADGRLFTGNCGDNTVRLWDPARAVPVASGRTKKSGAWFVAVAPDGKRGFSGAADKLVHVWDLEGPREPDPLAGHTGHILGLDISADGRVLASASQDRSAWRTR